MKTFKFAAAVLIAVLVAVPVFGARGQADFTKFVALGDSYGAGFQAGSLNERHQPWSWPAVIARQVGLTLCPPNAAVADPCFAQPLVSFPGIGPELVLTSLQPTIAPAPGGLGQPIMVGFGRPYNNLSIPGATVGALLQLTGGEPQQAGEPLPVTMGRFILRNLGGTAVDQAIAQRPTFIAIWIGGNDILGPVLQGTSQGVTAAADFKARYELMLDRLIAGAPQAGMVVGTLPTNPAAYPFLSTIPPFIVDPVTRQPILNNGQLIPFLYDAGNGQIAQLPPGSLVLLSAQAKLARGIGFPPVPPFNQLPEAGVPLAGSDVITPTELASLSATVNEYNRIITEAAAARDIPVADIKGLFDRVAFNPLTGQGGIQLGPIRLTSQYITGGFFGLDGLHLTDLGYLLFANEYIKAINQGYDTRIPVASITQLFANNGAFFPETVDGQIVINADHFVLTEAAARQITTMWAQPTVIKIKRRRH